MAYLRYCPRCSALLHHSLHHADDHCCKCGLDNIDKLPKCKCGNILLIQYRHCPSCGLPREEAVKSSDSTQKEADIKVFKSKAGPRGPSGEDIPRGLDPDNEFTTKLSPTVEDIELARRYVGKSDAPHPARDPDDKEKYRF